LAATAHAQQCPQDCPGDLNLDGTVTINELITSVNSALNGCLPAPPTSADLRGNFLLALVVTGGTQAPKGASTQAAFAISQQSGNAATGSYQTATGAAGTVTATVVDPCETAILGHVISFTVTQSTPCAGTFHGTAVTTDTGNVLNGFYTGSDCHGTLEVAVVGGRSGS